MSVKKLDLLYKNIIPMKSIFLSNQIYLKLSKNPHFVCTSEIVNKNQKVVTVYV
jgi:hypothetical protein